MLLLTASYLVLEVVGGLLSHSLALLADAGHMLVDALALLFAWLGARFAQRPADALRSFGYARLEVLVGYSNALLQFVLVAWIVFEAVSRLFAPGEILSGMMLAVAIAGLLVNLLVLRVLHTDDEHDLNAAGARLHVLGDLLGSVGAIVAALLMFYRVARRSAAVVYADAPAVVGTGGSIFAPLRLSTVNLAGSKFRHSRRNSNV